MSADKIEQILERLRAHCPGATYELDWETPEQMLVATSLAAQCTDERVNAVTKTLFKKYPDPRAFAEADVPDLEEDLKPTGFYRQKTRTVMAINKALVERFDGQIPRDMDALTSIDGVARKTANVVLNCCFDMPTGVIVDTHVARVSQRMGLSSRKSPEQIEADLMKVVPQEAWTFWGPAMVLHGRYVCTAKAPDCAGCPFLDLCPRLGVDGDKPAQARELHTPIIARAGRPPLGVDPESPAPKATPSKAAASADPVEIAATGAPPAIDGWVRRLAPEMDKPYFRKLLTYLDGERASQTVYPPPEEVFSAFSLTPFEDVKVVVLGQDPYHGPDQAHGLSFSVKQGVDLPPSLKNIYKEYQDDLGLKPPTHGHLADWARSGVMMLNAVLTVRHKTPNSHKDQGWETFTDAVIKLLNDERDHVVFLLWGSYAQKKGAVIDTSRHTVINAAHPSPLSARKGFFGSRPFSTINTALKAHGQEPIDWRLS